MKPEFPAVVLLALSLASCGKPAPPPGAFGAAPSGPFWDSLSRVPAVPRGKAGYLVPSSPRAPQESWTEVGNRRWLIQADKLFVENLKLPEKDLLELAWAELKPAGAPEWAFAAVKLSTSDSAVRAALGSAGFESEPADSEILRRGREKQRVTPIGGWWVITNGNDAAVAELRAVFAGKRPSAQTLPNVPALAAALGKLLPASVSFGMEGEGFPDSAARVVGTAEAPDAAASEQVKLIAFSDEKGPDLFLASENWKNLTAMMGTQPKFEREGALLRLRTPMPGVSPVLEKQRVKATEAEMHNLKSALEMYRIDNAKYPASLAELKGIYAGKGIDAWGRPITYRLPGPGGIAYELRSAGPDGIEGTADDVTGAP